MSFAHLSKEQGSSIGRAYALPATGIGYRAPLYLKLRAENWRDVEMADWGGVICVMSGKRLTTG